jgi:hypothetical protein
MSLNPVYTAPHAPMLREGVCDPIRGKCYSQTGMALVATLEVWQP